MSTLRKSKDSLEIARIKTRRDLYELLQTRMISVQHDLSENKRVENENRYLKSLIVEVDSFSDQAEHASTKELLKDLFDPRIPGISVVPMLKDEEGLFEVAFIRSNSRILTLYIDTYPDKRFWFIHSLGKSKIVDTILKYATAHNSNLDHLWLWPAYLESIQKGGSPRGFSLSYDYSKFDEEDSEVASYLKMQLWGGQESLQFYNRLKQDDVFANKVALARVRSKFHFADQDAVGVVTEDIKYNGKFVAYGTDFPGHIGILQKVRDDYKTVIRQLEEKYSLRWRSKDFGRIHLEGNAIHFLYGSTLPVQKFCEKVFDGSPPFRLLGHYLPDYRKHCRILAAVDMHTGSKINFEVWPDQISVYLPEGSCGNTVVRFCTNLHHYFSTQFKVETDDGESLFQ